MDIHRCRFVPFPPSPINTLAFSHPSARSTLQANLCRLAVGRANGDIEIWNPSQGIWHQETIIQGGQDRSVDGLVWVVEPDEEVESTTGEIVTIPGRSRLFSIGYTSAVTEWDLEKGRPLRTASGQHGDIWCIAAQPPASSGKNKTAGASDAVTKLVAGTNDGALAIYSIADGELRFQRVLVKSPTRKTQMVSIAFQSRDVVVVGCSDSTLRAYDMRNGNMLRKMTLGSDLVGGAKEIIVWSVRCLPSGEIISGDSTGHVTIWDGKTYTQMQRILSHRQDVLSLAAAADGTSFFSGGMDRRTVLYKRTTSNGGRWGKVWSRKYHEHDVKTMASYESAKISVVVSGGPDASPIVLPLKEHGRENHRTLPNLPQQAPLQSASKARFVMSWWDREVNIWKLRQSVAGLYDKDGATADDLTKNRKLLKTILVKGESSIASATISSDGAVLVTATSTDIKAFHLRHNNPTRPSDVQLAQIQVPRSLVNKGARKVQISPDGKWLLVVTESNRVLLVPITYDEEDQTPAFGAPQKATRVPRKVAKALTLGGLGKYDRLISLVAFGPDSRIVAVADLAGYIDTWVLRDSGEESASSSDPDSSDSESDEEEESSGNEAVAAAEKWHHTPESTLLPKLLSPPAVLSFTDDAPSVTRADGTTPTDYTLFTITTNWHISAFHPLAGALTPWTRRNNQRIPLAIRDTKEPAKGVLWQGPRAWIFGVSYLFMLDLSQDLDDPRAALVAAGKAAALAGQKRKRKGTSGAGGRMAVGSLVPNQVDRYVGGKDNEGKEWQLDVENAARSEGSDTDMLDAEDDEDEEPMAGDDDDEESGGQLAALRNKGAKAVEATSSGPTKFWETRKYRPVLGVVALEPESSDEKTAHASGQRPLEVVLIERPIWDVDMPERLFAANEVER
ncbi:U3 small nucleolar RNA-associated protein [Plectosphaerella cucumerina]|uniref:U3 small nucleolar RNA-associated protein n=1 Tax=Plectosphaerella cucumerina TaxID=40658 RepID=A0A8K0TR05_9PEZI|nr:U3 small nucleolar RNA-associated protein [Plectosphaerella cucumerina]